MKPVEKVICIEKAFDDAELPAEEPIAKIARKVRESEAEGRYVIRHSSLEDLIRRLVRLAEGRAIKLIELVGHGAPGQFSVGNDFGTAERPDPAKNRALAENNTGLLTTTEVTFLALHQLRDLGVVVEGKTTVRILGCSVAGDDDLEEPSGSQLAEGISKVLGCWVEVPLGYVGPDDFDRTGFTRDEVSLKCYLNGATLRRGTPKAAPKFLALEGAPVYREVAEELKAL